MSWLKLSINTTAEAVDWVRTLLSTTAYGGDVQVIPWNSSQEAHQEASPTTWDYAIRLYLTDDFSANSQIHEISQRLASLYRVGQASDLEVTEVSEKPTGVDAAPEFTHRVGQRFVVVSPHTSYTPLTSDEILLSLGDSLAFGSGLHPATMLSLRLLERYVSPGMTTLDLGSGSGILSIAMAKLGAKVLALDNDPVAVYATQNAVMLNKVEHLVTVSEGSLGAGNTLGHWMGGSVANSVSTIEPIDGFDLVVANILARIHIALAPDFQQALRQTDGRFGFLITAGFTADYEPEVTQALEQAGFKVIDYERIGEWVALAHQLKAILS
jgi:ribosomal protein L11 methyltransferase